MTTTHKFKIRKGAAVVDGKSVYPNYLIVEMDRDTALGIIADLVSQLRTKQKRFHLEVLGQLSEEQDEP